MKRQEFRCTEEKKTKSGRTVKCGAFLFEAGDYDILVRCRKCSTVYRVVQEGGELVMRKADDKSWGLLQSILEKVSD